MRGWWLLGFLVVGAAGLAIGSRWLPEIEQQIASIARGAHKATTAGHAGDTHDHNAEKAADAHDDGDKKDEREGDHEGEAAGAHADEDHAREKGKAGQSQTADHKHDEAGALQLSQAAEETVGVRLAKLELRPFERTITVPAMIVERPGRSTVQVAAPLSGVVTRIWPLAGETVTVGQPLVELRLTHEEVVEAQAEFLRTAEDLDVVRREIARLESVSADGAIPGKVVLDRRYEQQKLEAAFRAQRQRLLLHGFSASQVDEIAAKRTLLSAFTVNVPEQKDEPASSGGPRLLQIEELKVAKGQHVKAGDPLCTLADHATLYIQGRAFEQDAAILDKAASNNWLVTAVTGADGSQRETVPGLPNVYLANRIEPESRAYLFYVEVPNKLVRNRQTPDGRRFSGWQFKPGQRLELLIPVERWPDRIVLPTSALVQDGAESYVFEKNNGHFDRRAVRVEYRDPYSVVIANDGTLALGKMVIVSGAYQVHLALKNKAGGAPDPHAGHNH
jgi:multidrug efflux pump subunit AcrA (membrane-fusion protein)